MRPVQTTAHARGSPGAHPPDSMQPRVAAVQPRLWARGSRVGLRSSSRAAISPDIDDVGSQCSFCLAHLCHRASLETAVVNPVRRCTTTRGFVPIYVPWLHQAVNKSSRSLGSNRYTDAAALQVPTKPRYEKLVDNNKYYI